MLCLLFVLFSFTTAIEVDGNWTRGVTHMLSSIILEKDQIGEHFTGEFVSQIEKSVAIAAQQNRFRAHISTVIAESTTPTVVICPWPPQVSKEAASNLVLEMRTRRFDLILVDRKNEECPGRNWFVFYNKKHLQPQQQQSSTQQQQQQTSTQQQQQQSSIQPPKKKKTKMIEVEDVDEAQ